jgi:hypothetical protein
MRRLVALVGSPLLGVLLAVPLPGSAGRGLTPGAVCSLGPAASSVAGTEPSGSAKVASLPEVTRPRVVRQAHLSESAVAIAPVDWRALPLILIRPESPALALESGLDRARTVLPRAPPLPA